VPAWDSVAQSGGPARLVAAASQRPDVIRALAWVVEHTDALEREIAAIAAIPSPTFAEHARATYVAQRLAQLGARDVCAFGDNNVCGRLGPDAGSGIALLAHLDTVFPTTLGHEVTRRKGRLYGPGVGDNAAGVAGLLGVLAALVEGGVALKRPLWFVGDAAEEGLGDLRGARQTMVQLDGRLEAVIAVEGTMLGRLGHIAVGSKRLRVHFSAPGGHSWLDFGRPSAVHAAVAAAAKVAALPVPREPRTTINVGRIEGGEGVNVIASSAEFLLDLRSVDSGALDRLLARVGEILEGARRTPGISVQIEQVGDRPVGAIPRVHPLVELCAAAIERVGLQPEPTAGSTDANVPLSMGVPAVALGITRGGGIHSTGEWIELDPLPYGVRQLVLVCAALVG